MREFQKSPPRRVLVLPGSHLEVVCLNEKTTVEHLGSFSDGVFAVIVTILVLELSPPEYPKLAAPAPLTNLKSPAGQSQ